MVRFDAQENSGEPTDTWHEVSVLFCSQGTLDLSCLKVEKRLPSRVKPADLARMTAAANEFDQGSPAIVLGHALFDPQHNLPPTVAVGSVAKLIPYRGIPMILQTSASVFRGDSGGMVISEETGRILGMITSNARQADAGIIPELNFSIPSTLLPSGINEADSLSATRVLEDWFSVFERLSRDSELEKLWDLQNTEESEIARVDREAAISVESFLSSSGSAISGASTSMVSRL
eukprot:g4035.t1